MHLQHLPREDTSCQPGETFYACSTGDFRGCCSIDPCERGFCAFDAMTDSGDKPSKTVPTSTSSIRSRGDMTLALTSDDTEMSTATSSKLEKDRDEPTSTKNDKPSKTMTDSGITHTIPNNNPVTITKHTIIVTDKTPTPKPSSALTPSGALWTTTHNLPGTTHTHTVTAGDSAQDPASSSPPTGLIAGVSIGGAIALGICTFLLIRFFRRRRLVAASEGRFSIDGIRDNDHGEKNYLQVVSPHTTGTQGSDPFAPFGGRTDRPHDPLQPPADTFEMDGTSTAPVELPAEAHNRSSIRPDADTEQYPVQPSASSDPRANLNASLTDRRQNTYVTHWNQYRNMGSER